MEITDQVYSRLDEREVQIRIGQLGQVVNENSHDEIFSLFQEFLEWKKAKK